MPHARMLASRRPLPANSTLAGALLLGAVALGFGARPALAQAGDFGIQAGDQIEIRIFTQSGEPLEAVLGTRYVDQEGQLYLPFVGSVQLGGLDSAEIRSLLERRFASFYDNPVVDVSIRFRVNVTGAVRSPGHYFVVPGATIQDALAMAGGVTSELDISISGYGGADPSQVRLVRGEEIRIIDMRVDALMDSVTRDLVVSGDWIYVPIRPRARLRENLELASNILTVLGSIAAIISVVSR